MTDNPNTLSPSDMLTTAANVGVNKANMSLTRLLLLSFLAGAYIAFGALFASVVATGMSGVWPYGFMKLLQGLVFSLGLILVVVAGAELFTGNNLMVISLLEKKISFARMLRNWLIVYLGNFLGSITVAVAVLVSQEYKAANGALGSVILSTANNKVHLGFPQALVLGILCNILVCLAVWLTYGAKTTTDKILSIVFPITFFVAAGFEHSVANMFSIPVGILLISFAPSFVSSLNLDLSGLTWNAFLVKNLLPVTIGNILGGSIFVGCIYFLVYHKSEK